MRFLFLSLIIVAAAVFGLYGYAKNLPETNKFTIQKTYEQPIELVWQGVANYEVMAKWDSNTKSITKIDSQNGHEVWHWVDADDKYMDLEVIQSKEPYLHISKIIASDYPFTGSWTFEIAKIDDNKTLVKLTEEGTVPKPFWRLVIKHIIGEDTGAKQFLSELDNGLYKLKKLLKADKRAKIKAEKAKEKLEALENSSENTKKDDE